MRFFANGLILPALALALSAPAFADKPVEPAETAHHGPEVSSFFRPAAKPLSDAERKNAEAAPEKSASSPKQQKDGPSKRVLAQQQAIKMLAFADGDWRGPSKVLRKDGWVPMTETQRVATLADGTIRTIESRGYEKDGRVSFSMFAVISYDPDEKAYSMHAWSNGRASDYPLEVTASGFSWEYESSPQMTVRYEAVLKNGVWTQTATRIPAKGDPEKYVEFTVRRVGSKSN